jgi:hypothetical protein
MTIDERLEALAQTVELLASMHKDNEKEQFAEQRKRRAEQKERDVRIDQLHAEMMIAIARLANTAEAHNGQLDDHEQRIDKLESR